MHHGQIYPGQPPPQVPGAGGIAAMPVAAYFKPTMEILMTDIATTLAERGSRYGSFLDQSTIACDIKHAMEKGKNWTALDPDERECLDMIAVKIARILNGDPHYHDSWHDIGGYAKLVADRNLARAKV